MMVLYTEFRDKSQGENELALFGKQEFSGAGIEWSAFG